MEGRPPWDHFALYETVAVKGTPGEEQEQRSRRSSRSKGDNGRILNARLKLSIARRLSTACVLQRSRSVFSAVIYKQDQHPVTGLQRQDD
jgi:hypothetical protein